MSSVSVFARNLKKYRQMAGFKSAMDFAAKMDIPYQTYIAYENKNREPKFDMLCRIALLLNTTPNVLLGFTASDPNIERVQAAVAAALGAPNQADPELERVKRAFAFANLTIEKAVDEEPDPRLGEKYHILKDGNIISTDYWKRLYLLSGRIIKHGELVGESSIGKLLRLLYDEDFCENVKMATRGANIDIDLSMLSTYISIWQNQIEPMTTEEINAIISGRAKNPLFMVPQEIYPPSPLKGSGSVF